MTSPVDICNQALSWLGAKRIMSLEDETDEGRLCKINYLPLRNAVLEERAWTFADRSLVLASPSLHEWGQGYKYQIPTDVLVVYRVFRDISTHKPIQAEWYREGEFIVALNDGNIYCKATALVEDPDQFSTLFAQALAARMAADLAIPVTRNRQLQADMWGIYNAKLLEAAARDGVQGRSMRTDSTELVGARYSDGSGIRGGY